MSSQVVSILILCLLDKQFSLNHNMLAARECKFIDTLAEDLYLFLALVYQIPGLKSIIYAIYSHGSDLVSAPQRSAGGLLPIFFPDRAQHMGQNWRSLKNRHLWNVLGE
jgi:hypothetical protein